MRNVSPDVRSMNFEMPCPCIGPQRKVRRMIRSNVPCMISRRSVDLCFGLMGRQPTTRRVDVLPRQTFQDAQKNARPSARRAKWGMTKGFVSSLLLYVSNVAFDTFRVMAQL